MDLTVITQKFLDKTLPKEAWTHQAHLAVAFTVVNEMKDEAASVAMLREHIKAYNESVGTKNTDESGYHETLTVFWVKVVRQFLTQIAHGGTEPAFYIFVKSALATSGFPFRFYTKEVLFTVTARKFWVEPDLIPLSDLMQIIQEEV